MAMTGSLPRWPVLTALGALTLHSIAAELEAQARAAGAVDAVVYSRYVWRGITRRNDWVVQPDIVVGATWPTGSLSVGAWANLEFSRAEPGGTDVGLGEQIGEWNAWAQVEQRLQLLDAPTSIALGYIRYFVDRSAAAAVGTTVFNTSELYLDGRWRLGGFEPRATVWYDVEEVKGAYAELSAAYRLPVFPLAVPSLYLKMLYAFSWGQAISDDDPNEGAYFAEDGLTHIDFSAEVQVYLPVGPLTNLYATPSLHFQVNTDDATGRLSRSPDDIDRGSVWWGGLALSWYW